MADRGPPPQTTSGTAAGNPPRPQRHRTTVRHPLTTHGNVHSLADNAIER
jgi:hypothetical protein